MTTTEATPKPITRVWVYSRTSGRSDREDRGEKGKISLPLQDEKGREMALKNGWTVVGASSDDGYSGRTYPFGADAGQVSSDWDYLEYCKTRIPVKSRRLRHGLGEVFNNLDKIDAIVIRDITRLCRPFRGSGLMGYLFQRLKPYNISLVFHGGQVIPPTDDNARMFAFVMMQMEDSQVEGKHDSHKLSIASHRDKGELYRAIRCYGYTCHDRVITPDTTKLATVKGIFAQFNGGENNRQIAAWAQREDNKRYWTRLSIIDTITNPIYCGHHRDTEGNLMVANYMKSVYTPVSLADWQKANALLLTRRTGRIRETYDVHPASGLLKCGYCGSAVILTGPPDHRRYRCLSVHRGNPRTEACTLAMLPENTCTPYDMEDDQLIARGVGIVEFLRPLTASAYLDHLRRENGTEAARAELAALDHKEADIKVKAANITRMYSIGTMEPEEVEVAADSFKLQRAAIAADRARLMAANAHYRLSEGMDWRLAMYGGLNARTLQNLLRSVLNRVEIFGYHVRVTFKGGTGFTLPRQVAGNRRTFPLPMVSWVEGSAEPPKIRYLYEDVKPTEVHTFKNITIEVCGQPTKPQARGERAKLPWFKDAYNLPLAEGSPDRL